MGMIVLFDSDKGSVDKSTLLAQICKGLGKKYSVAIMDCEPQRG